MYESAVARTLHDVSSWPTSVQDTIATSKVRVVPPKKTPPMFSRDCFRVTPSQSFRKPAPGYPDPGAPYPYAGAPLSPSKYVAEGADGHIFSPKVPVGIKWGPNQDMKVGPPHQRAFLVQEPEPTPQPSTAQIPSPDKCACPDAFLEATPQPTTAQAGSVCLETSVGQEPEKEPTPKPATKNPAPESEDNNKEVCEELDGDLQHLSKELDVIYQQLSQSDLSPKERQKLSTIFSWRQPQPQMPSIQVVEDVSDFTQVEQVAHDGFNGSKNYNNENRITMDLGTIAVPEAQVAHDGDDGSKNYNNEMVKAIESVKFQVQALTELHEKREELIVEELSKIQKAKIVEELTPAEVHESHEEWNRQIEAKTVAEFTPAELHDTHEEWNRQLVGDMKIHKTNTTEEFTPVELQEKQSTMVGEIVSKTSGEAFVASVRETMDGAEEKEEPVDVEEIDAEATDGAEEKEKSVGVGKIAAEVRELEAQLAGWKRKLAALRAKKEKASGKGDEATKKLCEGNVISKFEGSQLIALKHGCPLPLPESTRKALAEEKARKAARVPLPSSEASQGDDPWWARVMFKKDELEPQAPPAQLPRDPYLTAPVPSAKESSEEWNRQVVGDKKIHKAATVEAFIPERIVEESNEESSRQIVGDRKIHKAKSVEEFSPERIVEETDTIHRKSLQLSHSSSSYYMKILDSLQEKPNL